MASCGSASPSPIDPALASEIASTLAIDNHAHVVRVTSDGERDREFDALPVDNMEPASDPLWLRPDRPRLLEAWRELFGYKVAEWAPGESGDREALRAQVAREHGTAYPAWILDRLHIETMVANRVAMGTGLEHPRFTWAAYADALMFPLDTSSLASRNSDRRAFFALERSLFDRYARESTAALPADSKSPALPTLGAYLSRVVTPTLERHRRGGAIAEKFEAAYLRDLDFGPADRVRAERTYSAFLGRTPPDADYKILQDFLFRYIAAECGRLGMAVHLHTGAGAGSYFDVAGVNPLLLESVLDDPTLRKTNFVLLHGGWPFERDVAALLLKPNVYVDFSSLSLLQPASRLAGTLREWLEWVPEKVMFGTDAYPYSSDLSWETSAWLANANGREALSAALTGMMRDGEITRGRARQLGGMVMHDNAKALYTLPGQSHP
jgi:predicted TIM-barrel fold metal-dependent hydrolase